MWLVSGFAEGMAHVGELKFKLASSLKHDGEGNVNQCRQSLWATDQWDQQMGLVSKPAINSYLFN